MDPTAPAPPRRFAAIQHDDDGSTRTLGQVALDEECRITVIASDPDDADTLSKVMARMNNKPVLHVDAPAPPGAPRFALASRIVQRGDPEFLTQLEAQLSQYYDIELQPL